MVIVMRTRDKQKIDNVVKEIEALGYQAHLIWGVEKTVVAAVGDERGKYQLQALESLPGVESVVPILKPYKLAGLEVKPEKSVVDVDGIKIGDKQVVVMAGPCSVESREQILETAEAVKEAGALILRGGAFKPRTSPYSFQGLEEEGLKLLAEAREKTGLKIITEVMSAADLHMVAEYADILQIGARNMQNFPLLKDLGTVDKPVMLKRGMSATVNELLMSAEYVLSSGNSQVILCERGIRTFETATRNTLDLNAVPFLEQHSHLPVIVDPSHGTGIAALVGPMSKGAIAVGADGLLIEVHPHPEKALSDGSQSLRPEAFRELMHDLAKFAEAAGRTL